MIGVSGGRQSLMDYIFYYMCALKLVIIITYKEECLLNLLPISISRN